MSDTPRPFKKMAGGVEVLYFPKRRKSRGGTMEIQITKTLTIPDFAVIEQPTPPNGRSRTPLMVEATEAPDAGKRRRTKSGSTRKPSGTHKRRTTGEITIETQAPAPSVAELLAEKNPAATLRKLSRWQVTEVAVEGHGYFERGDLDTARRIFEHLVALEPSDAFPYTMLGTIFLALGQQDRALALFEAALGVDRKDLAARVYRGEVRLHRGRYKLAIDDLQRALDIGEANDPFVDRARRLLKIARQAYTAEQAGKKARR